MDKRKYIIYCHERGMWWMPNERGYTKTRKEAGIYSHEQATRICQNANQCGKIEESMERVE